MSDPDNPNKTPDSQTASDAEAKPSGEKAALPTSRGAAPDTEFSWAHAFAIVGTLALLVIAFLAYIVVSKRGELFPSGLGIEEINRNANKYLSEQAGGDYLVLKTIERIEHFLKIPENAISTGWISPEVATERLQVPVVYEFGVPVNDATWTLELQGNVCLAKGPPLEVLRVLYGSDAENYTREATTVPRPKEKVDPILQSLEPQLDVRALMLLEGKEGTELRALAKETLETMLEEWLLDIGVFKNQEFATVKVVINGLEPEALPEEPAELPEAPADSDSTEPEPKPDESVQEEDTAVETDESEETDIVNPTD